MNVPETPIVHANGTVTDPFRTWGNRVGRSIPIVGSGSPEGVVEAPQFTLYIRSDGTTGSLIYVKKLTDISGDRSQGWVAA